MGYNPTRILTGQLICLISLLLTMSQILFPSLVGPLILENLILCMLLSYLWLLLPVGAILLVVCGIGIILSGVFQGTTHNPFELFGLGLAMLAGGIGFFVLAGVIHWGSFVNSLWTGPGTKSEAIVISVYASIQLLISCITIMKSLPSIFQEMIKLSKTQ